MIFHLSPIQLIRCMQLIKDYWSFVDIEFSLEIFNTLMIQNHKINRFIMLSKRFIIFNLKVQFKVNLYLLLRRKLLIDKKATK